jgi:hypothetical protein
MCVIVDSNRKSRIDSVSESFTSAAVGDGKVGQAAAKASGQG